MNGGISAVGPARLIGAAIGVTGVLAAVSSLAGCATAVASPTGGSPNYRDGEYEATGWYGSLPSHQDVTLTLESGVVIAVEITSPAQDETSLGYQQRFAEALPDEVVGQNIDELDVDRVAGASGCSEGFMNAIAAIKERAAG